jgi:mRNA-decapping enzyme 1B
VYSRVAEPFNSIFINNRLNTNSLVEPINPSIQQQLQSPFLLYRNQKSNISGFWFYCKDDCVRIHGLLEKLIKKCNNSRPAENSDSEEQSVQQQIFPKNQNGNGSGNVDIFSMLSKAQEDFNNSSVSERSAPPQINQQFAGMHLNNQQQPVLQQPLMKQLSNTMPDITSNVVNFFAAAQQPNGKPDGGHMIQPQNQFVAHHQKVPPVQTLDEIEKQHRVSASPPNSKIGKNR